LKISDNTSHYQAMGIEPLAVIEDWSLDQQIGVLRHGVLKYIMRLGTKDAPLKEATKALDYAARLVDLLEKIDEENESNSSVGVYGESQQLPLPGFELDGGV